jgi:hypothetical protein
MKHLICIIAALASLVTFTACGDDDKETTPSTTIALNKDVVTLTVGDYDFVAALVSPDPTVKVIWSTADSDIATIDNGKITAVGIGNTQVMAMANGATATCWVVVIEAAKEESNISITLDETEIALEVDKAYQLEAKLTPKDETATIVWTTDNESVASVSNGKVTALAEGEALITAKTGSKNATCRVHVNAKPQHGDYRLVWSDEFDGTSLNTDNWNVETGGGGWGNQELQYYTNREENLRVADGNLIIDVRKEQYENRNYTSARITTKNKRDFTYGKVEARIKLPKGGGTWPAFWMLGYGSWPYCGEIDIMEHVGNRPDMTSFALHTSVANGSKGNNWHSQPTTTGIEDDFHIFGVEWVCNEQYGRDVIYFTVDGERMASKMQPNNVFDKSQWPFYNPFYIILNVAMGGTMGGKIDDTIFESGEPVQMLVDWVRVYQY